MNRKELQESVRASVFEAFGRTPEELVEGEQVHVNHKNCPAGADYRRRLYVYNDTKRKAVLWYCHNCSEGGVFKNNDVHSLMHLSTQATIIKETSVAEEDADKYMLRTIIDKCVNLHRVTLTESCKEYLDKISMSRPGSDYLFWMPDTEELIVPIYFDNELSGFNLRQFSSSPQPSGRPKWVLKIKKDAPRLTQLSMGLSKLGDNPVIITEDAFGTLDGLGYQLDVIGLLGSSYKSEELLKLLIDNGVNHVYLALDKDLAGYKGTSKLASGLSAVGIHAFNFWDSLDNRGHDHSYTDDFKKLKREHKGYLKHFLIRGSLDAK